MLVLLEGGAPAARRHALLLEVGPAQDLWVNPCLCVIPWSGNPASNGASSDYVHPTCREQRSFLPCTFCPMVARGTTGCIRIGKLDVQLHR